MGVGAYTILCSRASIYRGDDPLCDNVQKIGCLQYRHSPLYRVALSAMGYKTVLESVCRHNINQTPMGHHYAMVCGNSICRDSVCIASAVFL